MYFLGPGIQTVLLDFAENRGRMLVSRIYFPRCCFRFLITGALVAVVPLEFSSVLISRLDSWYLWVVRELYRAIHVD